MTDTLDAGQPAPGRAPSTAPPSPAETAAVVRHRSHRHPGREKAVLVRYDEDEFSSVALAARATGLTPTGYVAAAALAAAQAAIAAGSHSLLDAAESRPPEGAEAGGRSA